MPFVRTERIHRWAVRAQQTLTRSGSSPRPSGLRRPSSVLAAVTATALVTALMVPATAVAGPADSSTATGRFLSGSVLGLPLDPIVSLGGATATNAGQPDPVTVVAPLSVTVLDALRVQTLPDIDLPFGDLIRIGVANQYAQAADDGVSRSASGAVSDDGGVSVNGTGDFPADASLDLRSLLGSDITGVLGDLDLRLGAITGVAAADAADGPPLATTCVDLSAPVNCRDYAIADAQLTLTSPAVAGIADLLTGPTGVAATVDTAVAGLSGPNGLLASALATVVGLPGLVGNSAVEATVTTGVRTALTSYLATPLVSPSGAVRLDLITGAIVVDLDTLLTDAGGAGLAALAPGTELLRAAVLAELVDQVGTLLQTIPATVQSIVTTALNAAQVRVAASVCIIGTGSPCSGFGATGVQVLVAGTVAQVVAGTAPATLAVQVGGLPVSIGVGALLSALAAPLAATLLPLATSTIPAVTAGVGIVLTALDPVLRGLNGIVALTGNVQENGAPGVYREVALRISLLGGVGGVVDLGRADVGPNVDVVLPTATSLSPSQGPAAGGTVVAVTGSDFIAGETTVTIDGTTVPAAVLSPTQLTFATPAHIPGTVDVTVTTAGGVSTPPLPYTYLPVPAPVVTAPAEGATVGTATPTFTGTGVDGTVTVSEGGLALCTATVVDGDWSCTSTTPLGNGPHTVTAVQIDTADNVSTASAPVTLTVAVAPVVGALSPVAGPVAGGQTVTVTGTGFETGATVTVDGLPAGAVTVVDATSLTFVTPAHPAGIVDVVVTTTGGVSTAVPYTYVPVPVVAAVSPSSGPQAGGTTVTVSGSGFVPGATAVTVDGTTVPAVTVVSETELSFVSPPHPAGAAAVVVTTPGGTSAPLTYTYLPLPAVAGLSPAAGPVTGGQTVTVTGTGFTPGAVVTVDGITAADVVVTSATSLTFITPAHVAGPVEVTVTTTGGDSTAAAYTYVDAPVVESIDPVYGPVAGGTSVTATGAGFVPGATVVIVDGATVPATVGSPTSLTFVTPAHPAGPVPVTVVTAGGASSAKPFVYLPVPTLTSASPTSGPQAGGQTVTVTGDGFVPGLTLTVDGAPVAATALSATELFFVSPPHGEGAVPVVVTTPGGTSTPLTYTYLPLPAITGLSPAAGPVAGGQTVTVTGTGFSPGAVLTVDGAAVSEVTVTSATSLTFTTPAHVAGPVEVVVTTTGGVSAAATYTYLAVPVATSVSPSSGPQAGGTMVTVTGSGFVPGATAVTVDGTTVPAMTVVSATELTFVSPAHAEGAVPVVVTTPGGTSVPLTYTYLPLPAVSSLSPAAGPVAGGQMVTVTGTGFAPGAVVTVDGAAVAVVTVTSATSLTYTSPAHAAGTVAVTVTTDNGTSTAAGYEYVPVPVAASLDPGYGPTAGGQTVTVTGSGFVAGATVVLVDGTPVPGVSVDSATSLTFVTPAHPAGTVPVVVVTAGGESTPALAYRYAPAPVVTGLDPSTGPAAGGQTVTVTGTGFVPGSTVVTVDAGTVGAIVVPPADTTVVSDTTLTFVTPAHPAGPATVTVQTAAGAAAAQAYTYLAAPAPTVTGIAPATGPLLGGSVVTVTGTGFAAGVTSVVFDALVLPAADVTVTGPTSLTFRTPPGTLGGSPVTVSVTNDDTAGVDAGTFTYAPPVIAAGSPVTAGTAVAVTGGGWPADDQVTVVLRTVGGVDVAGATVTVITTAAGELPAGTAVPVPDTAATGVYSVVAEDEDSNRATAPVEVVAGTPVVNGISPDRGPLAGGTAVTVTGSGFAAGATVSVGRVTVVPSAVAPSEITLTVPAGAVAGPVDVIVDNGGGATSEPVGYTYDPPTVNPTTPVVPGGTTVVTGGGFPPNTPVTVTVVDGQGTPVTSPVTVVTDGSGAFTVVVTVPAGTPSGAYSLVVRDGNGNSAGGTVTVIATSGTGGGGSTGSGGAGGGGSNGSGGGSLAYTGEPIGRLVPLGLILLLAGVGLLVLPPRRSRRRG